MQPFHPANQPYFSGGAAPDFTRETTNKLEEKVARILRDMQLFTCPYTFEIGDVTFVETLFSALEDYSQIEWTWLSNGRYRSQSLSEKEALKLLHAAAAVLPSCRFHIEKDATKEDLFAIVVTLSSHFQDIIDVPGKERLDDYLASLTKEMVLGSSGKEIDDYVSAVVTKNSQKNSYKIQFIRPMGNHSTEVIDKSRVMDWAQRKAILKDYVQFVFGHNAHIERVQAVIAAGGRREYLFIVSLPTAGESMAHLIEQHVIDEFMLKRKQMVTESLSEVNYQLRDASAIINDYEGYGGNSAR